MWLAEEGWWNQKDVSLQLLHPSIWFSKMTKFWYIKTYERNVRKRDVALRSQNRFVSDV